MTSKLLILNSDLRTPALCIFKSHKHLKINMFNVIHCINKIKFKTHMIISVDAEKEFDKIQYPLMIKTHHKVGTEGMYLNIIKTVYDKPRAKYFLPFCRLPFHFIDGFLCRTEAF